ncbi:hypothetical protein ACFRQM_23940, partial [Streptomyces sp. NPDC056831]
MTRATTGLWDINSIGRVSADGRTHLVAVLSGGQRTKETGIALVESVAKTDRQMGGGRRSGAGCVQLQGGGLRQREGGPP